MGSEHDGGDEDDDDDEGLNEEQRKKDAKSKATSTDDKAAAARSAEAKEKAQKVRDQLDEELNAGKENPNPSTKGYDVVPAAASAKPGEPVYSLVVMDPETGQLVQGGSPVRNQYAQASTKLEGFDEAATNSTQAQIATNAAEAGEVDPAQAECHRAEQASREAEQLEVENAENNGDNRRAREARARRNAKVGKVIGIGAAGTLFVAVATLVPLVLTGVISLGGDDDDDDTGGDNTPPAPVPGAPDVKPDITLSALNPAREQSVSIPDEILTKPDPTVDKTSVELASADEDDANRYTVPMSGFFRLDPATGALTFNPLSAFSGGLVQAGVSIANAAGKRSPRCIVNLDFDTRPLASTLLVQADLTQIDSITINPLTGTGIGMGDPVKKGTNDIDPRTVIFLMPMPLEGGQPMQGDMTVMGGKTAKVEGEGEWKIDATTGDITFTRDPAFDGSPTPITYQVYDIKGIPSTLGSIVITAYLDQLTKTFDALNSMSDAAFWTQYVNELVNGDWGALDQPSEIVGKLTLYRTVHLVVFQITRQNLSDAEFATVVAALPDPPTINTAFRNWAMASFTTDVLYSEATRITPTDTPAAAIKNGDRMLRLRIIAGLLGRWSNMINDDDEDDG